MSPLEKMARAAYDALIKESADGGCYVGNVADEGFGDTVVEGVFSLERVLRAALLAIREPGEWAHDFDGYGTAPATFTAMIDAILNQEPRP